jgi:uncharacterized protein
MAEGKRYVDVNIFVYWLGYHPLFGVKACNWIKKIENSPTGQYVTSSLTLYESLVILAGLTGKTLKNKSFTEEVIKAIAQIKGLTIEPLKADDFIKALDLMDDYKLDFEDATHLAVAARIGAVEIVSNDKDFESKPIKRIM